MVVSPGTAATIGFATGVDAAVATMIGAGDAMTRTTGVGNATTAARLALAVLRR